MDEKVERLNDFLDQIFKNQQSQESNSIKAHRKKTDYLQMLTSLVSFLVFVLSYFFLNLEVEKQMSQEQKICSDFYKALVSVTWEVSESKVNGQAMNGDR